MNARNIGEDALIRRLAKLVPGRADVVAGIGDDCAVVRTGRRDSFDWLLKSDPVIEGVHFTPTAPAEAIGHKALGRVLSDIAAMGGEPMWVLIDLVAPASVPVKRIEGMYRGLAKLARRHGVAIVGGDTARGKTLELHIFAVGRIPRGRAVLRSGGKPGDSLYVTGSLGGSGQGRHLRFEPRLVEGAVAGCREMGHGHDGCQRWIGHRLAPVDRGKWNGCCDRGCTGSGLPGRQTASGSPRSPCACPFRWRGFRTALRCATSKKDSI